MFKKNNDQKRFPGFNPQGMPPQFMPQQGMMPQGFMEPGMMPQQSMYPSQQGMFPGFQHDRLQFEIMENRRRLNNLAKRVARIESYLRIKDVPEYGYVDEEKPSNFSY